jgi:hypothetical protein
MQESDMIPRKEFARKFGEYVRGKPYCLRTVIDWERQGYGPRPIRIGRDVIYSWKAAIAWLDEQVQAAHCGAPPVDNLRSPQQAIVRKLRSSPK